MNRSFSNLLKDQFIDFLLKLSAFGIWETIFHWSAVLHLPFSIVLIYWSISLLKDLKAMASYVGFANLPNQVHRKSVKKGFEFTLMVVGKFSILSLSTVDLQIFEFDTCMHTLN